jgi:hypothetical protein
MRVFKQLRIYVASSYANAQLDDLLAAVRSDGHEAYDFRAGQRRRIFDPRARALDA